MKVLGQGLDIEWRPPRPARPLPSRPAPPEGPLGTRRCVAYFRSQARAAVRTVVVVIVVVVGQHCRSTRGCLASTTRSACGSALRPTRSASFRSITGPVFASASRCVAPSLFTLYSVATALASCTAPLNLPLLITNVLPPTAVRVSRDLVHGRPPPPSPLRVHHPPPGRPPGGGAPTRYQAESVCCRRRERVWMRRSNDVYEGTFSICDGDGWESAETGCRMGCRSIWGEATIV